tara:strand:+ start:1080 stop:2030 length:951 start_codon:yes stop_codon:yes gene_type:complete
MILLVTNERDVTTDYLVLEFRRRNLNYFRLNCEHLPDAKVVFSPSLGGGDWEFKWDACVLSLAGVKSAYFRRPGAPQLSGRLDPAAERYCIGEWSYFLSSALNSLGNRWLNSPLSILAAEDKPRQLRLAIETGFLVPSTFVSNDIQFAKDLLSKGEVVAKSLNQGLIEVDGGEKVIFTTSISSLSVGDEDTISLSPVIFQEKINKTLDVRVTVVGARTFSAEILSQAHKDTQTDWRRTSVLDVEHAQHVLPRDIEEKCVNLVAELDLKFGAIDLAVDQGGDYWFLEINPNGQWAWIENRTGLPITSAIVDELARNL